MGVLGLLAAVAALSGAPPTLNPQRLPPLPLRGFAQDTRAGVELQTMRGRPLGVLAGLDLAPDKATSHGLLMRDRRGRLYALDRGARRVRQVFAKPQPVHGCRLTDARLQLALLVCGHTVKTALFGAGGAKPKLRVVAKPPGRVGHWVWAVFAPQGSAFLAQWSAECEVPVAFLAVHNTLRPYGGRTCATRRHPSRSAGCPVGRRSSRSRPAAVAGAPSASPGSTPFRARADRACSYGRGRARRTGCGASSSRPCRRRRRGRTRPRRARLRRRRVRAAAGPTR